MTNAEKFREVFGLKMGDTSDCGFFDCTDRRSCEDCPVKDTKAWWNAEYKEPTTKNDLELGAVSRQAVLELIADNDLSMGQVVKGIHALPLVTLQEPRKDYERRLKADMVAMLTEILLEIEQCGVEDSHWIIKQKINALKENKDE